MTCCSGCRLCCDLDESYNAYGGVWARTHRTTGRVGSVFDPGGAVAEKLSPKSSVPDQRPRFFEQQDETPEPPETTDPEAADSGATPSEPTVPDPDAFQKRLEQFKEENLESIRVTPGEPLPPDVR